MTHLRNLWHRYYFEVCCIIAITLLILAGVFVIYALVANSK